MILPKTHPCPECSRKVSLSGMLCLRGQKPQTREELEKLASFIAKITCGCYRKKKPQ